MGGSNKAFTNLRGQPLVAHVRERLGAQVMQIVVSANLDVDQFTEMNLPVVRDLPGITGGPLSGILAGLRHSNTDWLLAVPTDMPCLPRDLVARMLPRIQGTEGVAVVHDGCRRQNAVMLMHRNHANHIEYYLKGARSIRGWLDGIDYVEVDYSDQPEAFANVNTPADLAALERPGG